MWGTLRTFIEPRTQPSPEWAEHLWVIVPYDRRGVLSLARRVRDDASVDSFLDKAVQVRFVVPQTILSNWRAYLFGLLRRALPHHAGDYTRIYLLKAMRYGGPGLSPSPRDLIRYVNDLVALHEQWGTRYRCQIWRFGLCFDKGMLTFRNTCLMTRDQIGRTQNC